MGQAANNRGRNASLDEKKLRAAGRGDRNAQRDFDDPQPGSGKAMGAFGGGGSAGRPRRGAGKRKGK